jgi:hypothetical protein
MIRRSLSALALLSASGMSAGAKPPDLPLNKVNTVTPRVAPEVERPTEPPLCSGAIVTEPEKCGLPMQDVMAEFLSKGLGKAPGSFANDYRPLAHPLLTPILINYWVSQCFSPPPPEEMEKQLRNAEQMGDEQLPPARTIYDVLPESLPTPTMYQLRPTVRNTFAGSLFGVDPLLALLPTEKALDAPHDHPQKVAGDDVLGELRRQEETRALQGEFVSASARICIVRQEFEKWLMTHWAARHATPSPEENEGYIHAIGPAAIASLTPGDTPAEEIDAPLVPAVEALPMPKEDIPTAAADGPTCPYLRQKAVDRHACQLADPEVGRDVLENLDRLMGADKLVELAKELARDGRVVEAMNCCLLAADLCPGSPSAARAADMLADLCFGPRSATNGEESAEAESSTPPGVEQQVNGLMKACRLLVSEGLHQQAAELARQAYALDPERVLADPLIYKMHLLADAPAAHRSGGSEASEPPSCPYCPVRGKPIREIAPDKKKNDSGPTTFLVPRMPKVDYKVVPALKLVLTEKKEGAEEASEEKAPSTVDEWIETLLGGPGKMVLGFGFTTDGGLRLYGECSCASSVYHVMYSRGCLALWKNTDAAKLKP